jgi:drug/metabolite transporter (DMT)-like permease
VTIVAEATVPPPADPVLPSPKTRGAGVAMLVVAAVLWSVSGIAVKLAARDLPDGTRAAMDPFAFAMYRSLFAALAMLPLLPFSKGNLPRLRPMLASVALSAAVYAMLIVSMTVSTSGTGILLQYTGPIFCALFAWLFQGRTIGRKTLVAMAIASAGIAVMIAGGLMGNDTAGATSATSPSAPSASPRGSGPSQDYSPAWRSAG